MRIGSNVRGNSGRGFPAAAKVSDLRKSDLIADIFNNQPQDKEDQKNDVKLHISNTARALNQEFKGMVSQFLAENPKLVEPLSKVPLPDETLPQDFSGDLTLRQLQAYNKWMTISEKTDLKGGNDPKSPYAAIHAEGKDDEIKSLLSQLDVRKQFASQQRKKNLPNYYYAVYPETYSFN